MYTLSMYIIILKVLPNMSASFIAINHTHNNVDGQLYFSLQFWGD